MALKKQYSHSIFKLFYLNRSKSVLALCSIFLILNACIHGAPNKASELADQNEALCFGDPVFENTAVYLHGLDSKSPSLQEIGNRKIFEAIAKELKIRIAVPRATKLCNNGSLCWGWALNDEEMNTTLKTIREAALTCSPSAKDIGLIGFSNGGYMIMKIFRSDQFYSTSPSVTWGLAIGSGMMKGPIEVKPTEVRGDLILLVGENDKYNYDPNQNYYNLLKKKSNHIRLIEFDGGHEIPPGETQKAIKYLMEKRRSEGK